jgi:hypothetical protein
MLTIRHDFQLTPWYLSQFNSICKNAYALILGKNLNIYYKKIGSILKLLLEFNEK